MKKYCIVLASGTGARFGADVPKQFVKIRGRMVIEYTLAACDCGVFDEILLVVSLPYLDEMRAMVAANGYSIPVRVVAGGSSRKESCEMGVAAIQDDDGYVVIHNGVQPFVPKKTFEDCLVALEKYPAVTSGVQCVFTILETDEAGVLRHMPLRNRCYGDLGPECFRLAFVRKVFEFGANDKEFTNITGIVMKHNLGDIFVVEGDSRNIKITYPEDVLFAERILSGK